MFNGCGKWIPGQARNDGFVARNDGLVARDDGLVTRNEVELVRNGTDMAWDIGEEQKWYLRELGTI